MGNTGLSGQRVAVIGGTGGMGLAIARRVASGGAEVIVAGRDQVKAQRVAEAIGGGAEGRAIDLLQSAAIDRFFAELGGVDHLVVAASQARAGGFRESPVAEARETFDGKFWGAYQCARVAAVRRSILLFSGIYSRKPAAGVVAIGATNAAIEGLARGLAVELAPLRVNVISPGLIQGTDAYAGMAEEARAAMIAATAEALPAGLVGTADSVAGIACELLASDYVTGAVIDIDGGALLR